MGKIIKKKENETIPPKTFTELYQKIAKRKEEIREKRKIDKEYVKVRRVRD